MKEIEDVERARVAALLATGLSVRDIAEELGLSKSAVHRLKQEDRRGNGRRSRGRPGGLTALSHCPSP